MNALYMSRNSGPDVTGQEKKSVNGDLIPGRSSDLVQKASGVHPVLEALFEGYSDSVKLNVLFACSVAVYSASRPPTRVHGVVLRQTTRNGFGSSKDCVVRSGIYVVYKPRLFSRYRSSFQPFFFYYYYFHLCRTC
jgi:hypothetical protein